MSGMPGGSSESRWKEAQAGMGRDPMPKIRKRVLLHLAELCGPAIDQVDMAARYEVPTREVLLALAEAGCA
jgi:hypothetical protein